MGRLPNDVKEYLGTLTLFDCRTQIIASDEKENALLEKLLILDRNTTNNHTQSFSDG